MIGLVVFFSFANERRRWVMGTVTQRAMLEPESLVLIRGFCRWT